MTKGNIDADTSRGMLERVVGLNRAGEWPENDTTQLEAGANRCAAR